MNQPARQVIVPEIVEDDSAMPPDLRLLRDLARLLDTAFTIPGTRRTVGLDAMIGLVPGIGDFVGAVMSSWIIAGAIRHRVPFFHVLRMLKNVIVDLIIGSIPVVGDVFDIFYKPNIGNIEILFKHRNRRKPPRRWRSIALAMLAVLAVIIATGIAVIVFLFVKILAWRDAL